MKRVLAVLTRIPEPWATFGAWLLAVAVGALDLVTGYDFHLTAFYLVPICWVCWVRGRSAGLVLAVVSSFFVVLSDRLAGHNYEHSWFPFWNGLMLLAVFGVAVEVLAAFMVAHQSNLEARALLESVNERLEETVQERTSALLTEVAERHRIETAKIHVERLLERQEKLAVLGTLTAGMAHEIRNPLTSLKARLYTLEKHLHAVPAARKDTDIIGKEISRLEHIVRDALSFARPAEPQLALIPADVILREILGLMSLHLENRQVHLAIESAPNLFIRADSGHLKQVLINLVQNAADAIDGLGTVTLRIRAARLPLMGHETDVVVFEVSDTGKGILPEVEKRLFDPFFSTKETGTGLGLPIAARIVQKHGGVLTYRTQLGKGTTFEVVLPGANDTAESAMSSHDLLRAGAARKEA